MGERATGEGGSKGRRGKRLDGRDTLAPNHRWTGGSLRSAHSNTTRSSSVVDRLTRRPVPRPFSPPPFHNRSRPSRDDPNTSPRGLFAPSSNDVRRRCCATGDRRRAHDRHRVETGRLEPRDGPERKGARLPCFAFKCRRTVVEHRPATSHVGLRGAQSTRHANGSDSMKRGRVPRRTTSDTVRRHSPFRVKSPHAQSHTEHLPWRSNDVRTSCEVDSMRPRGDVFGLSRDGL